MASIIKADTLQSTTANVFILNSSGTEYARFDATGVFQLANPTTFSAGTAALPSITATGDTNTGIFFPAADTIAFSEGGAESMRIDSSGNVGIGTSSPAVRLNVTDSSDGGNSGTIRLGSDGVYYGQQQFRYNSSEYRLGVYPSGNMTFYTKGSESMRIDSSGNLLVGTTSSTVGSVSCKLGVVGSTSGIAIDCTAAAGASGVHIRRSVSNGEVMTFDSGTTRVGSISVTGSATAYNTSSDYRLKDNIEPMTGALNTVAQLKPVTYKWKVDGSDGEGFIAHELAEVKPDCVSGDKDALDADGNPVYQGIDTSFLVATLTAAIQELKAINDTQAETINALTANLTALTARIAALESTP